MDIDLMFDVSKHGGALLKTGLGVVVALCFAFMELQRRSDNASREATETKLFALFEAHRNDSKDTATRQWQNQTKIAEGLNAVVIQLARIESLMRIPIENRSTMPESGPPKTIQLKPPM